jgi:ATP-dependent helicase/nuclease subunit A
MDEAGVLSLTHGAWTLAPPTGERDTGGAAPDPVEPDWLRRRAPAPKPVPTPIAPSRDGATLAGGKEIPEAAGTGEGAEAGLRRGRLMHLLLEHLPGAPPETWPDIAVSLLAGAPDAATEEECAALLDEARAVIGAGALAWIFAPDGLSEVPVLGRVAGLETVFPGRPLDGKIDRLLVAADEVWAIDFKSDRLPPPPGALPPAYAGQLALYAAALREIFPGRAVRAGILWTAAARLDEAPAAMLNEMVNGIDRGRGGA